MKVLHIGNIANNAYLNAKILNDNGIKSDVLCYDYYHIMGCPEWEDSDFIGDYGDDNAPNWSKLDLQGFKRPDWFIQGRKITTFKYLIAKNEGSFFKTKWYGFLLKNEQWLHEKDFKKYLLPFVRMYRLGVAFSIGFINNTRSIISKILKLNKFILFFLSPILIVLVLLLLPIKIFLIIYRKFKKCKAYNNLSYTNKELEFELRIEELKDIFYNYQPERIEYFDESFFFQYKSEYYLCKKLFKHYDVIHTYGLDGFYPMLVNLPYIAFEHGTIRNFPFQNDMIGICSYLSYKLANHVFITNADNIEAAKKLEFKNYSFIPHPINESVLEKIHKEDVTNLYHKYDTDFIAFHPPRQHWTQKRGENWMDGVEFFKDWEKGNDIFIEGFAKFVKEVNPKAKAIFVLWGKKINESKNLIKELGIEENIIWVKPMHNYNMIKTVLSVDILVDQFTLGAFGSTMPKALMCHKPSMMYLNESLHKWCLTEMPPVENVQDKEQVYNSLKRIYLDKQYVEELNNKSFRWYDFYHSNKYIFKELLSVYSKVKGNNVL